MDALQSQVNNLTYDLENLESIKEQYRSMMIWYFRELKCEQFDDEGHLDVNASAQKALEADLVDDKANAPGNTVMEMSRYLMDQLITQMIYSRDNVLYNSISIDTSIDKSIGEKAVDKKAYEAEVYTKKDKNFDNNEVEFSRSVRPVEVLW